VLEQRKVTPVGANKPVPVNIRVIAATNLPPEKLRDESHFRQDLLFRLNTVEIDLPPLRERREDVPQLIEHYLQHYAKRYGRPHPGAQRRRRAMLLLAHDWPGNVRALRHALERAVILAREDALEPEDFSHWSARSPRIAPAAVVPRSARPGSARRSQSRARRAPAGRGGAEASTATTSRSPHPNWGCRARRCIGAWRSMGFDRRFTIGLIAWIVALVAGAAGSGGARGFLTPGLGAARIVALAMLLAGGGTFAGTVVARHAHQFRTVARFLEALQVRRHFAPGSTARAAAGSRSWAARSTSALDRLRRPSRPPSRPRCAILDALVDDMPVALLTVDAERAVTLANKAARRLFRDAHGTLAEDYRRLWRDASPKGWLGATLRRMRY
jgi:PAS domain-containing protein